MRGKYKKLKALLAQCPGAAVAFSGGVDSTFLLHAACVALGPENVHALHARSPLLPAADTLRVADTVRSLGCRSSFLDIDPFAWPEFVQNQADRCYHCKKKIYHAFLSAVHPVQAIPLVDGTNQDDLQEDRPGLKAISELHVATPLAEAGLTKKEIRLLSREFGLPSWNAHSASCFATRIGCGEVITKEKIHFVSEAESLLAGMGFFAVRVRLSGQTATIVPLEKDLVRIKEKDVFTVIKEGFVSLGAQDVSVGAVGRPDIAL